MRKILLLIKIKNNNTSKNEITIRRIQEGGAGLRFLRAAYTIVTAFWAGFLFAFSLQLLLFLQEDFQVDFEVRTCSASKCQKP